VLECLGGTLELGAGRGDVGIAGGVGTEVAFPRSYLVEGSRRELVQTHEWVGLEGGAVWVSGRIRRGPVPFFHEQVLEFELQLGVGAALGGLGVGLAE